MNQVVVQPFHLPIVWAVWSRRLVSQWVLAAVGVCLLTISARVQIPSWPVPMTMQTYAILVIGMAYGTRLGVATVLVYLAAGAAGLPVFAGTPEKGVGISYMAGPTGGYLLGFVVAAWVCGCLAARGWDRGLATSLIAMATGHLLILGLGVAWLATLVGWSSAVKLGLSPFIAVTVVKTLLAAATLPVAWRLVARVRHR